MSRDFTIIITTYNRKDELAFTLSYFAKAYPEVSIVICDDFSTDGTAAMVRTSYPTIQMIVNTENKGLIHNRNVLLEQVETPYAISIDDDAHFLTNNNLESIRKHFDNNPRSAVVSFRLFWGLEEPSSHTTHAIPHEVSEFAGGAHAMRMAAWEQIPPYPAWYKFYGEEQFASLQFLKKEWKIHYLPEVLVHHRVANKARKKNADYITRTRRALHASWSNYWIFYPLGVLPRKFAYSIYQQVRSKVFKGDLRAGLGILGAMLQIVWNLPKLLMKRNSLSLDELRTYEDLPKVDLYWTPEKEKKQVF